jgi:transposase
VVTVRHHPEHDHHDVATGARCALIEPSRVERRIAGADSLVARLARALLGQLTAEIDALAEEITSRVRQLAPPLLAVPGCGTLTAAKILGETAGIDRFKSKDAYARHNGTAPLPVWSANHARHRLSRTGNRQLSAAIHRIALTQAHWHPPARAMMARRKATGDSGIEALRVLKRRPSDVIYAALRADIAVTAESIAA